MRSSFACRRGTATSTGRRASRWRRHASSSGCRRRPALASPRPRRRDRPRHRCLPVGPRHDHGGAGSPLAADAQGGLVARQRGTVDRRRLPVVPVPRCTAVAARPPRPAIFGLAGNGRHPLDGPPTGPSSTRRPRVVHASSTRRPHASDAGRAAAAAKRWRLAVARSAPPAAVVPPVRTTALSRGGLAPILRATVHRRKRPPEP